MPPGVLPPPVFNSAGATPLSTLGGAPPAKSGAAGPSEFTQMISRAPAPVVRDLPEAPKSDAKESAVLKKRLPIGLIVVVNVVIVIALLLVVLIMRRPSPATVKAPTVTAPTLTAPAVKP